MAVSLIQLKTAYPTIFFSVAKTRPLISYYGGKQRIASKIVDLINKIPHNVYVEPFAGGAAVFYKKGLGDQNCLEVLNDTNRELINLYKVAKNRPQKLKEEINKYRYSRSSFNRSLKTLRGKANNSLEKAAAAYVSVNQGFGNKFNQSGWGQKDPSRKLSWKNRKLSFLDAANRLRNVRLSCEDAISCIKKFDSPNTLFYLDPPYPGAEQGHYKGYTIEDFRKLLKVISESKGSFVLSNYNQKIKMPSGAKKYSFKAIMSVNNRVKNLNREREEIVWVWNRSKKKN